MTKIERALICALIAETDDEKAAARATLAGMLNADSANQVPVTNVDDVVTITRKILVEIGVPCHIKGHDYLVSSIVEVVHNPDIINTITNGLYPTVAKKHNTTSSRTERAIRHAIEVAWDRCPLDTIYDLFGNTISAIKGKPTNAEFIARTANIVRERTRKK